ncbi:MAG: hypothetical protein ABJP02_09755 [Parasphingorhabdus sp.]|uniref:hypothetical protein n=1 Tax=Parasphingorhabdus sp. TaxID=2709688 RepID=UPI0032993A91
MIESAMPVRRGEPFKVLLIVLLVWVMGRVIWHDAIPASELPALSIIDEVEGALLNEYLIAFPDSPNLSTAVFRDIISLSAVPVHPHFEGFQRETSIAEDEL